MSSKLLIFMLMAIISPIVFGEATATCIVIREGGSDAPRVSLDPPVHPRGAAMARATIALDGTSEAMFYNPAVIAMTNRLLDVTLAQNSWIADIILYQGSIALRPAGGRYGTIGFSFWRKDFGRAEFSETEVFHFYHQSIGLAYALCPIHSLSIGGHVSHISESNVPKDFQYADVLNRIFIVYDLGLRYRTGLRSLLVGLICRNYWRNADERELAYVVEAGAAMDLLDLVSLNLRRHSLMLSLDRVYTRRLTKKLEIGAEYAFSEMVFIRAGYRSPEDHWERNLGAGLRVSLGGVSLQLDYARGHMDLFGEISRFAIQILY